MTRTANDRVFDVVEALEGTSPVGLAPMELARAAKVSASWVSVNLPPLAERGYFERDVETGRWRLGRRLAEIAAAELAALDKAGRRVEETKQRYRR